MNAVTSPAAAHRRARWAIGRSREFGSFRRRGRDLRQVSTFAAIGVVSTLADVALYSFLGSDPAPTLDQLKAYVASGQLRFVLAGGGNGGGGGSDATASARTTWLTSACTLVECGGSGTSTLYDCAGASWPSRAPGVDDSRHPPRADATH